MTNQILFLSELFFYIIGTLLFAACIAPLFIRQLVRFGIGKNLREESPDGKVAEIFQKLHAKKKGTPTMGGVLIWGIVLFVILFSRFLSFIGVVEHSLLQRSEVYLPLFTMIFVGLLGAVDDYFNVKGIGKIKGLSFTVRSSILILFGLIGGLWFYFKLNYTEITIPFYGLVDIGWWYIPFFIFVIFSTSNAVNVTDGLDGLAGGLLVMAFSVLIALAVMREHTFLALFCGVTVGAILGFLWHNIAPAKFYMGDTGAFALGATLGVIALMIDMVFVLPFIGFVFFMESASVFIQLFSKKFFKRKVFKIAPVHHHFEAIGWEEGQIVMRAWIIGGIFSVLGLMVGLIVLEQQKEASPSLFEALAQEIEEIPENPSFSFSK